MTDDLMTSLERGSFQRLIQPLLDQDPSVTLRAKKWWIARAKKNSAWLEEDLAELPADQRDRLRALVEVGHA
jgi:hypothetical protein